MRFSIITPTIGRTTLKRTMDSVAAQKFSDYEHVIAFDGDMGEPPRGYPHAIHVATGARFNDFGHSVREFAWHYASGEYILYLDDDDVHINDTLKRLDTFLLSLSYSPDFVVFPCLRFGEVFFRRPVGDGQTTSCQYAHRKFRQGGFPIRFSGGPYGHDGTWIGEMAKNHSFEFMPITTPPLVKIELASLGEQF